MVMFSEQTEKNNLIGKTVSGYQLWFHASDEEDNGWFHWSRRVMPGEGDNTFEMYPDLREYPDKVLYRTKYGDLGDGKKARLFASKTPEVIDVHFSWCRKYGIDGLAVQRFFGESSEKEIEGKTHINLVMESAERFGRLFYVMYDFSGAARAGDSAIDRIKNDWVLNIEGKGIVSSGSYAHANGKPVVCLWGLSGDSPKRYPSAHVAYSLIMWFKERGYFVIGGFPDNKWAIIDEPDEYAKVYRSVDMASPWTVGRYRKDTVRRWWDRTMSIEKAFCEKHGILYLPVVFAGFAWACWNGGAANDYPRDAGGFMWEQARIMKEHGIKTLYVAMFDEYDEATAIMKAAEDSFAIPSGKQYFQTLAADGRWLSSDFYLRLTGKIAEMLKGDGDMPESVPVPHSNGPIFYRNSFEKRGYLNITTKVEAVANIDVCLYNEGVVENNGVKLKTHDIIVAEKIGESAKTGEYAFLFSGVGKPKSKAVYRISETDIKVGGELYLKYEIKALTELGRQVYVDLIFNDGSFLSSQKNFAADTEIPVCGTWTGVIVKIDGACGKRIKAVAVCCENTDGEFLALVDDIVISL